MIPSSPISALSLGPLTIHFYALCILAGIGVALWWATGRWVARGGDGDDLFDIVFVAIVAGIIGSRIWHVLTSPEPFFGPGGDPVAVLYIWQGRSEEHTSELQSRGHLVCRLLLEKKKERIWILRVYNLCPY